MPNVTQLQDSYWEGYLLAVRHAQECLTRVDSDTPGLDPCKRDTIHGCKAVISNLAQVPFDAGWEPEWSRTLCGRPN